MLVYSAVVDVFYSRDCAACGKSKEKAVIYQICGEFVYCCNSVSVVYTWKNWHRSDRHAKCVS